MKSPLPKLARSFAEAVGLARRETDPDKIEAALAEARKNAEAAVLARETAESSYRESLLDTDAAESERRLAAVTAARVEIDRNEALAAALVKRLVDARAEQDRARRAAIHADAKAKCDAVRDRLAFEYPRHAAVLRGLLRDLAEAEVARLTASKEAPDFPDILPPEDEARNALSLPEEIIDSEVVELWTAFDRSEPLPPEAQERVRRDPRYPERGMLQPLPPENPSPSYVGGGPHECTLRRFRRTRFREAFNPNASYESLLRTVALPGFGLYSDPYVVPERFRGPDGTLAHLGAAMQPPPKIERPVKERFEAVPEEPTTHETVAIVPFERTPAKPQGFGGSGFDPRPIRGERRA